MSREKRRPDQDRKRRDGDEPRKRAIESEIDQREEWFGEERQAVAHRILLRARTVRRSVTQPPCHAARSQKTSGSSGSQTDGRTWNAAARSRTAAVRLHVRRGGSDRGASSSRSDASSTGTVRRPRVRKK